MHARLALTLLLVVVIAFVAGVFGATPAAPAAPVRGLTGDLWADVIIGKPDFGEIMPNAVTGSRVFNPGGVLVDRSVRPNRVYVYDSNSRVLGFNHLGVFSGGLNDGQPCTSNSDYSGGVCIIQEGRPADLVLGQPSLDRSACNGDGNLQNYPDRAPAGPDTLCAMPEEQISTTEGGSFANMAVDGAGNLYVPDWVNHRVLRYDSPFTTDTLADAVWGQADFQGNSCNRGRGIDSPDAQSLCFVSPYNEGFVGGVGLDPTGNLWVMDNANNRALRFPYSPALGRPGPTADLVLGQPDFSSATPGLGLDQMRAPAAVRVAPDGRVYIADSQQHDASTDGRVLYFDPPFTNGMAASGQLNYDFRLPAGLEFDINGGLWVSDRINHQLLLFSNTTTVEKVLFKDQPDDGGNCGGNYAGDGPPFTYEGNGADTFDLSNVCDSAGSIGVDSDGNILVSAFSFVQDVWRFPAPIPTPQPDIAHSADARIFKPYQFAELNSTNQGSLFAARGVAVAANQLIVTDQGRMLFWNNPPYLSNGQVADGYTGAPSPRVQSAPAFGRIRQDTQSRLWALRGGTIEVYALPLTTGAAPVKTLVSPLPLLGGGSITWDSDLLLGGIAPVGDGEQVWVADPRRHRVFRIRDTSTAPLVDVVLGQADGLGTACNRGLARSRASLCHPGAVALDPDGNLYVSDHALEVEGNHRLLVFDASLFPAAPASPDLGPQASRVIGTGGSFTGDCVDLCGPWEPAFSSGGALVVGLNAYIAPRFPQLYRDPQSSEVHEALRDFGSMPYAATFDGQDNLYITDLNRGRVLIYYHPLSQLPPTATATSSPTGMPMPSATATSSPTRTPTPSTTPTATPSATPTIGPGNDPQHWARLPLIRR